LPGDHWTPQEEALVLAEAAGCRDYGALAAKLGRTRKSVRHKAQKMGASPFGRRPPGRPWSAEDVATLAREWVTCPNPAALAALAAALGRPLESVRTKANKLGFRRQPPPRKPAGSRRRFWTADEEALLAAEYPACPNLGALASRMGRTLNSVMEKADRMNLRRSAPANRRPLDWTPAEVRALRDEWPVGTPAAELAARFNRSIATIRDKARRLGLTRLGGRGLPAAEPGLPPTRLTDTDLDARIAAHPLWKPSPVPPSDPAYNAIVAERETAGLPPRHPADPQCDEE
jgi:hypothetical protein